MMYYCSNSCTTCWLTSCTGDVYQAMAWWHPEGQFTQSKIFNGGMHPDNAASASHCQLPGKRAPATERLLLLTSMLYANASVAATTRTHNATQLCLGEGCGSPTLLTNAAGPCTCTVSAAP
eukprot:GHRQ01026493.1.p1 GENE.GHRQ01026493.1~~GHRQ01026493.1.p1  ORF type:complete len:121 (+),score=2.50 GHRQ01026493.1:572-934(+)